MLNVQRISWPLIVVLALSAGAVWHVATAQEKTSPLVPPKLEKASQESKVDPPRQPVERALQAVPKPIADAPATEPKATPAVQQWEYAVTAVSNVESQKTLNSLGMEGWELVTVAQQENHVFAYLKRRK